MLNLQRGPAPTFAHAFGEKEALSEKNRHFQDVRSEHHKPTTRQRAGKPKNADDGSGGGWRR